ncbi:proactivator polypeptide-like 1 [Orycteropus afer afer]|uniref:Proactivator polypeptide-like 1 n=1 Tax=Orycteropus afer afer TaxID=1230840 RepID=A0A8B7B482_ORYAF|nr:proactivator polypeptide-like 1 [Orycteropus afer afer]
MLLTLLLLGLLGPATASPTTAARQRSEGSPGRGRPLQAETSAAHRDPSQEPAERKSTFIRGLSSHLACDVCMMVAHRAQGGLRGDNTEEDIRSTLGTTCRRLPQLLRPECGSLLEDHGADLVRLVPKDSPEEACRAVEVCPARRVRRSPASLLPSMPVALLGDEDQGSFCSGCKRLLYMSASNLQSKATKRDILVALKGGCRILPLPYSVRCSRFLTEYEPVLVASLVTMMEPDALCRKVGACHGAHSQLLGTDRCVGGPSFWCSSLESAQLCGAEEHCRRHMWKDEYE